MNEYEHLKPSLSLPQFHKNPSTGSICTLVTDLHRDAKIWRLSPPRVHINTNWPTSQIIGQYINSYMIIRAHQNSVFWL